MFKDKILRFLNMDLYVVALMFLAVIWTGMLIFIPTEVVTVMAEPEIIVETEYIYITEKCDHYTHEAVEVIAEPEIEPRYGFTDDDIYLMTVLLCGSGSTDGDGEYDIDFENYDNHNQISLVLSVVMNRVMSDKFPNTVSEVIWASGQFSPMPQWKRKGLPVVNERSHQIVREWAEAYDAHDLTVMSIPESHLYFNGTGTINISRERW